MNDAVFRSEVLWLNKRHTPIGFYTPKKTFVSFANWLVDNRQEYILDNKGNKIRKMLGYDIEYQQNSDGSYDFDKLINMRLVDWEEWITLPVRPYDLVVHTPKLTVRIPRVAMSMVSEHTPTAKYNTSLDTVYNLYDGICQYSKRKLKKSEASRDHVIPRHKGGLNTFSNIVLCDKSINSIKGDRYNYECGLPEVKPIVPKELPLKDTLVNTRNIPEWNWFLKKNK